MRVGLLGGTLDPIHLGHLLVAEEARVKLGLEEVIFIPTGRPWMKAGDSIAPGHHRMNMVRLAVATNPFFRSSSDEVDRPGPSYTVDTLEALKTGEHEEDDLYFILGVDLLKEFHLWKRPDRILELSTLVVVPRPGVQHCDTSHLDSIGPSASSKLVFLDGPCVGISGTEIRQRADRGYSVRYLVPEAVEDYLQRYGLYRNGR